MTGPVTPSEAWSAKRSAGGRSRAARAGGAPSTADAALPDARDGHRVRRGGRTERPARARGWKECTRMPRCPDSRATQWSWLKWLCTTSASSVPSSRASRHTPAAPSRVDSRRPCESSSPRASSLGPAGSSVPVPARVESMATETTCPSARWASARSASGSAGPLHTGLESRWRSPHRSRSTRVYTARSASTSASSVQRARTSATAARPTASARDGAASSGSRSATSAGTSPAG